MITGVEVAGVPADLGVMPAQVTILHGRAAVDDPPTAGSVTLLWLVDDVTLPAWGVGDPLTILGDTGPLFAGRIAERRLEHGIAADGRTYGLFTVTGAGPVAALGYRTVGDEPWPAEAATARAERILTLAEVPHLIDGATDATVLPRDVDSRPALDLLADLASSTRAAVVDLPDGRVLYQPLAERARPVKPLPWADFDPALTWAGFDPALTWQGFDTWHSADSEWPLDIPAAAVEWEPAWTQNAAAVINHIRVGYGPTPEGGEQPWTELVDAASITRHGRRYQYIGTQLQNLADAQAFTSWVMATRAEPRWTLEDVTVHLDLLDPPTRAAVLALACGDHITVTPMPTPTPEGTGTGIVEGWTYTVWGADGQLFERITLRTTALLESLAVAQWNDYPDAFLWQDHSALTTWADLITIPGG